MPICFLGILLYWWQACLAIIHLFTFLKSCFWCWQINEIHEQFIIALRDLFEKYKEITGYSGLHLRVLWHSSTTPKICNNMALLLLPQLNCQTALRKHSGGSCHCGDGHKAPRSDAKTCTGRSWITEPCWVRAVPGHARATNQFPSYKFIFYIVAIPEQ